MSSTKDQTPGKPDLTSIDNEHHIQIGLLNALYDAVNDKKAASEVNQILNQLTSYSELHFMSEELLMRMYAYLDYDDHVNDHEAMTEYLNEIMETVTAGKDNMALKTVSDMRRFLVSHINTRDKVLSEYLNKVQA